MKRLMNEPTALYLMKNRWSDSNYKIGVSRSPIRRLYEVNENYHVDAKIICTLWFPSTYFARRAESIWHARFIDWRTDDHGGNEWFSLTPKQVSEVTVWASEGVSRRIMSTWIYTNARTSSELCRYAYEVIGHIPQRTYPPRISLWTATDSTNNRKTERNSATRSVLTGSRRRLRRRKRVCTPPTTPEVVSTSPQPSMHSSSTSVRCSSRPHPVERKMGPVTTHQRRPMQPQCSNAR